jgi:plastocyanin
LIVAAACGGGGTPTTGPGQASQPAAAIVCSGTAGTGAVAVADFTYLPASATSAVGGTITWANGDSAPHTVTFDSGPDCGQMASGGTITATFNVAGSYPYHCTIHPSMKATVVVQ